VTTDRPGPGDLADRVASAVLAVPGVVDLSGGIAGEIATYLPGRRVPGIRLGDGGAQVHVVVAPDAQIPRLAAAVQDAVRRVGPQRVDVHVDDLREPEQTSATARVGAPVTTSAGTRTSSPTSTPTSTVSP